MVSVPEQARQIPMNATPFGFDTTEIVYPAVNTCATVTLFGARGLAGLHLGMFMGAGEEGGKGSENSRMLDQTYLDTYLHVLKQQAYVKAATETQKTIINVNVKSTSLDGIYVAGALEVWKSSSLALWNRLKSSLDKLAQENNVKVKYFQFDDAASFTVDVHVQKTGVRFTQVGNQTVVAAIPFAP